MGRLVGAGRGRGKGGGKGWSGFRAGWGGSEREHGDEGESGSWEVAERHLLRGDLS